VNSLHRQLLREAAELLGGRVQLGRALQLPAQDLARWMDGLKPMPRPIFLKVVDLILDTTRERAAKAVGAPLSCGGDVRRMGQRIKGGERDAR
jgi:hypothetical protein